MSQYDRHLTTEQLSAYLDKQLPEEEQAEYDAHLKTCEQCQQALAGLRQTVVLLRALPQPKLPRSFVLPADTVFTPLSIEEDLPSAQEEAHPVTPISIAQARTRRRARSGYGRNFMRIMSGLVAVLGVVLVLTACPAGLPHGGGAASSTTSSGGFSSAASSGNAPRVQSATNKTAASADNQLTVTPDIRTPDQAQLTEATASANQLQSASASVTQPPVVSAPTPNTQQVQPLESNQPPSPVILFFDLSQAPGRAGLGILLAIAGTMGLRFFRRRQTTTD
ncbi:MAG TPA: zf-HC2 domain-containing protein [Ktedonobacteraceae bacterium]|nr:zf-HC2 domain-containing protein [Ktedonobacteraceae bacterium]